MRTLVLYVNRQGRRTVLVGSWDRAATDALCARLRTLPTCHSAEVLAADVGLLFMGLSVDQLLDALADRG